MMVGYSLYASSPSIMLAYITSVGQQLIGKVDSLLHKYYDYRDWQDKQDQQIMSGIFVNYIQPQIQELVIDCVF